MKLNLKEIALFGILGALMFSSRTVMAVLPNIHLLALFIVAFTVVWRQKALYPIYVYVFVQGLFVGFTIEGWLPEIYIWTVLWGVIMLIPRGASIRTRGVLYIFFATLHGFLFGVLWAPVMIDKVGIEGLIPWIVAGISFDITHGVGNFACGFLIMPLIVLLEKLSKRLV